MTQPGHLVEYAKVMPAEEEMEKKEGVRLSPEAPEKEEE